MKSIAVIHVGAVGDLLQALPLLRAVRAKWPEARVTLIGRPERAALARLGGLADDLKDFDVFSAGGARAAADLVIDCVSDGRLAEKFGGARLVVVHPLPPAGWTGTAAEWILRDAARRLDLPRVPPEPEILLSAAALEAGRGLLLDKGVRGRFTAIHPGSGSVKKNWPADRFAEIARRLRDETHREVVWLAGPAELERGTLPAAAHDGLVLSAVPLDLLAAVLALADAYLGNDSGITHLAAAVRRQGPPGGPGEPGVRTTPTVALFGPSDAGVWAPRGRHVRVVRSPDGAMSGIGVERVWAEMKQILAPAADGKTL